MTAWARVGFWLGAGGLFVAAAGNPWGLFVAAICMWKLARGAADV